MNYQVILTSCLVALLWPLSATAQDIGAAFATASTDTGASVTLYTGRGVCVGEARAAMWRPAPGDSREPAPGCWLLTDGVVLISFLDGERGNIPARLLVRAAGL